MHSLGGSINNVSEPNCWWQIFPTDVKLLFILNPLGQLSPSLLSLSHLPQNLIHIFRKDIWMRFVILLGDNNIMSVCRYMCNICRNIKIKEICLSNKCSFYFPCKNLSLNLKSLELQSDFKTHFISVHVNQNQQFW